MKRAALRREAACAEWIPYTAFADPQVVRTRGGDCVQVLKLGGVAFESAEAAVLNVWHERLNVLWRNVASPQVALWTHLVRRRAGALPQPREARGFAGALAAKHRARLVAERLMVNELYVSIVYRPLASAPESWTWKALASRDRGEERRALEDALEACAKLRALVAASLGVAQPEVLTLRGEAGEGSPLVGFLALLVNAEWERRGFTAAPLDRSLATARLSFGTETLEYRGATTTRFGAMLGLKEYPAATHPGLLDALLAAPYPLVLTQSFAFLSKGAAQGLLERQFHRLGNAGDFAVSQAESLRVALDQLTSNEFVMGDHHLSLQVLSEAVAHEAPGAQEAMARALEGLQGRVAAARSALADAGATSAREDLALEAAFWAQLPGNFALRPRKAPITSRNFSALAPLHNYPPGWASGNHWGEALAVLATAAHSPYHFSLHASDAGEAGARRDTGHTFLCGPTGSGKSVLIGFLVCALQRFAATQVIFDKDRGLEILVRALGGEYLALASGVPTGFNPLALSPTPGNVEFLKLWLGALVARRERPLRVEEETELELALRAVLALPQAARRLARLVEYLDPTQPDGPQARLARWCEGGELGWVFDGAADTIVPKLGTHALVGIDVTEFLGNEAIRTPVTLYLFHLVRQLLDGRRLVCWMDEFWRLIGDPAFEAFAKDGPKTWRKLNGVMCLATQSPSDVLDSALARTVLEQTATKVLFPNADAQAADYVGGLGLTEREFRLIREELSPGSRRFLVKQGGQSVVCELDLKGFADELAVLSGRAREVALVERLRAEVGEEPEKWLSLFFERRRALE